MHAVMTHPVFALLIFIVPSFSICDHLLILLADGQNLREKKKNLKSRLYFSNFLHDLIEKKLLLTLTPETYKISENELKTNSLFKCQS